MARFRRMLDNWRSVPEKKQSAAGALLGRSAGLWLGFGGPNWSARSHETLVREGFCKNVVAHRSVKLIAECAASVPFILNRGDKRIDRHPLLDLIAGPNPFQGGKELFEAAYAHLQISGNSYVEAVEKADGLPGELYVLRPDRMKIVPGPKGWPARYDFTVGGQTVAFPVDGVSGISPILHLKTFHPTDDYYGLSPLEAAACSIDIHNAAAGWNKALLDNAARPSGALVFEPRDGAPGSLTETQFDRLKEEMETHYQGAENAGRPFLLEGGLKWQQIAFSPADMEFIQSKHVAAREIALAFGVPPMLLGIPGDNTFANYQEANRALWRLTLLPLIDKTVAALNNWLAPKFGADLRLDVDRDAIPALAVEREALWSRIGTAPFLTPNEKRRMVGLDAVAGGDELSGTPGVVPPGPFDPGAAIQRKMAEEPKVKIWRTAGDGKVRDSHVAADGQVRLLDEPFDIGGIPLNSPRDPDGPPDETFNCRCLMEVRPVSELQGEELRQAEQRLAQNNSSGTDIMLLTNRQIYERQIQPEDTEYQGEEKDEIFKQWSKPRKNKARLTVDELNKQNFGPQYAPDRFEDVISVVKPALDKLEKRVEGFSVGLIFQNRLPNSENSLGESRAFTPDAPDRDGRMALNLDLHKQLVEDETARRKNGLQPLTALGHYKEITLEAAIITTLAHERGHTLTTETTLRDYNAFVAKGIWSSGNFATGFRMFGASPKARATEILMEAVAWFAAPEYGGLAVNDLRRLPVELETIVEKILKKGYAREAGMMEK